MPYSPLRLKRITHVEKPINMIIKLLSIQYKFSVTAPIITQKSKCKMYNVIAKLLNGLTNSNITQTTNINRLRPIILKPFKLLFSSSMNFI